MVFESINEGRSEMQEAREKRLEVVEMDFAVNK